MTSNHDSHNADGVATYVQGGDPAGRFTDYYPAWLENLADDVTIEGSLLDGAALGPEAVRTIIGAIRTLYEHQSFNFAGAYDDNSWIEDYTAHVSGEPIGCAVLITSNSAGQTQHVAANYRPRSSLLLLSRLVGDKLAGTPMPSTSLPASLEVDLRPARGASAGDLNAVRISSHIRGQRHRPKAHQCAD